MIFLTLVFGWKSIGNCTTLQNQCTLWKYYILPLKYVFTPLLTASNACCFISTLPVSGETSIWKIDNEI